MDVPGGGESFYDLDHRISRIGRRFELALFEIGCRLAARVTVLSNAAGEALRCLLRHPVLTARQMLTTVPARVAHERRIRDGAARP